LALLVAGASVTGLLWLLGWPTIPSVTAFGTSQFLDLLKIALAVVAGLGGVVLLAVNLRKQRVTEAEHDLTRNRDRREHHQARNERFGTAAEQMAHDSAAVRLAGVYAMAGLADDWPENRQICLDVLTGYLRLPAADDDVAESKVRETLLRVLVDRLSVEWRWPSVTADFTGARFADVDLTRLATPHRIVFDDAGFRGAHTLLGVVAGERTTYDGAVFAADRTVFAQGCHIPDASFEGGTLLFDAAALSGDDFVFSRCTFRDATIVVEGERAQLGRIDFRGFSFLNCAFTVAVADSQPRRRVGSGARFQIAESTLTGCVFDLSATEAVQFSMWLVASELIEVRIVEPDAATPKPLHVRDLTLVRTEIGAGPAVRVHDGPSR
jgi:uncharacterized protein YjbI with pentapeptide repeats